MSKKIKVYGKSSKSFVNEIVIDKESNTLEDMMSFLRKNNVPIASSCYGEGVCNKCMINNDVLSCQVSIKEFCNSYSTVEVEYL